VFKLAKDEELLITLDVLEEVAYVGLSGIYGCRAFKLRDTIKKGLNEESIKKIATFDSDFKRVAFLEVIGE